MVLKIFRFKLKWLSQLLLIFVLNLNQIVATYRIIFPLILFITFKISDLMHWKLLAKVHGLKKYRETLKTAVKDICSLCNLLERMDLMVIILTRSRYIFFLVMKTFKEGLKCIFIKFHERHTPYFLRNINFK